MHYYYNNVEREEKKTGDNFVSDFASSVTYLGHQKIFQPFQLNRYLRLMYYNLIIKPFILTHFRLDLNEY